MHVRSRGPRLMLYGGTAAAFLIWRPIHDGMLRFGLPAALGLAWSGLLVVSWSSGKARIAAMALPLLALLPLLLPGKPLDRGKLREDYLQGMKDLSGTPYLWGGESARGIDCSGLPRRALRDALRKQALAGNGNAARLWLEQWWFDTGASAMKDGYRSFTRPAGIAGKMTGLETALLEPGDLAVTDDGRHVMAYLGGGDWIQADPGAGKVFTGKSGPGENPWSASRVSIRRWALLDG